MKCYIKKENNVKIRQGFVSNSSSSSFLISPKDKNKETITIKIEIPIDKFIDESIFDEQQLRDYIHQYGGNSKLQDNIKKILKSGRPVYQVSFSDESDNDAECFLRSYFYAIPQQEDFDIVEDL